MTPLMEIARDRDLDDTRGLHLLMGLRSRTTEAHSLLTALTPDERDKVSAAIVRALDEVAQVIKPHLADVSNR